MSETKLDSLLLHYNMARNQRVAVTTYQNAPPGSIDIERHALGNPMCFRSTKIVDEGLILKTIIIADPTLGMNYNSTPSQVALLIKLLLTKDNSTIYLWTGEFIRINTLSDFWSHYRACTSLLRTELEMFKEKEQLNQDNIIVLDNTSLETIAHAIIKVPDVLLQAPIDPPSFRDKESIEPQYFTSDTLMLYDANQQQRVLAWHEEHDYPLHLKLNGFAENRFPDFISYIQQYPQIILYFDELIYCDVEIWLTHLMQLPASQIMGVYQGHQLSPRSINAVIDFINQLHRLEILSINLPLKYKTDEEMQPHMINCSNLDLSKKKQLKYLSIKLYESKEQILKPLISQLNAKESSYFLNKLPRSLNYLYLPFSWVYSLLVLDEVLTKQLPFLKEFGNTDDSSLSLNMASHIKMIQSIEEHYTISLPQVKIINRQLLSTKGIEANQPYRPFAFDNLEIIDTSSIKLDFTPYYKLICSHCEQPDMTLEKAIAYIDKIINENNLNDLSILSFLEDKNLILNVALLLLIQTRMPKIKELIFQCLHIKQKIRIKSTSFLTEMHSFLSGHVWELDIFEFTVSNDMDDDLLDTLFSRLKVKCHVLLEMSSNDIESYVVEYFKDAQSLCCQFIEDAERCRNELPNIVINRNYSYTTYQEECDYSVDELKASLLESQQNEGAADDSALINDTDTVEDPSTRLSARQLFRTLDGQAVPVYYNRLSVRSLKNNALIENGTAIHPGTIFRYDHAIPDNARVYEAIHSCTLKKNNTNQIIPMLHPQDTLYKITTSHPIELSYNSERKAYCIKGLTPNETITITYQFHSSAFIANRVGQLCPNAKFIISASNWINEFRPYFYLFNWINYTPEGINGLNYLSGFPADKLPFLICAYFADFRSGPLQLPNKYPSADEIDNAIFHQKVGACRHRSNLAFKMLSALVDKELCAIEANLTASDVHQFLEFFIGGEWVTVCLGGFNAQIDLQNTQVKDTEQATQQLSLLEEIGVSSLFALNQPTQARYFPYEDSNEGWEELYAETEHNIYNSIIQGFNLYSCDLMEQSDLFHKDNFFNTLEVPPEVQNVIQSNQPPKNLFLHTYPKLSFANSQDYRWWLEEQLNANNNSGSHLLLVVDSIDKQVNSLQRDADEYITNNEGCFASISDFQHIKFAELQVDAQGNKTFHANELGTLVEKGGKGDMLWININQYQAATINPLFDHRKKLRDKHIPDEVLLIAVMEERQFQEMSDDFTSRFSSIYQLDTHSFRPTLRQRREKESIASSFVFGEPILSFDNFAGYYAQKDGRLQWHEGWLTQQIKRGTNQITLINPPTCFTEFNLLMSSLQQGYYYSNGECISVPESFGVTYKKQPYDYPQCTIVSTQQKITINVVLNKTTLTNFLRGTYELLDNGSMRHHPSLDVSNTHGYTVLLSESLSNEEWYTLLSFIRDAGLSVRFALAPGVTIPNALTVTYVHDGGFRDDLDTAKEYSHVFPLGNGVTWIESEAMLDLVQNTDTVHELPLIYLSYDAPISDLLGSFVVQDGQQLAFVDTEFNRALRQGKGVVIYGNPNNEVRHLLESLMCTQPYLIINGTKQYITGPLSLYLTPNAHKSIIPAKPMADRKPETVNKAKHLLIRPHLGLEHQLHQEILPHINEQRISIISGLPQSGKSYLMHQLISNEFTIHQGITYLDSWLAQGGILLIDHGQYATLEEHSLIEQVHHAHRSLYLKGQFYPLSPQHKMILIVPGPKPVTSFFTVNSPSMHCEPFSEEIRLDKLIKPLWLRLNTAYSTLDYWPVIKNMLTQLQGYKGFGGINQLLMALAYIDELTQHESQLPTVHNTESLSYLCDLILCLLCPAQSSKEIKNEVQKTASALITNLLPEPLGVTVTPMQTLMVCNLMLHLRLVERARTNPLIAKLLVKGIIIEGSPGIGKTYLTQLLVHAMGYQQVTDSSLDCSKGYVLAPTDDLKMCKEQLLLAKEKGYLIFFDELNTLAEEHPSVSERSLIAQLIDALEPNHQEEHSTGFYMIASQNTAAHFGNRLSLPGELTLRCITLHPGEFRKQDYQHLSASFKAKEPEAIATEMKNALRHYMKAPNKYKKPTVRSFIGFLSPPRVEQSVLKRKREANEHQQGKTPAKKIRH